MRNLPMDLTDRSLRKQLDPLVKALNITDWACRTPERKSWGSITFLRKADGETFLRQHSAIPLPGLTRNGRPRTRARLVILGANVFCCEADKPPDKFLLKSLEKKHEDSKNPDFKEPEKQNAVVFKLTSLSCGHYEFPRGKFAYCPDVEWPEQDVAAGILKFAKRLAIVTFTYANHGQIRLEIPYGTINEIVVSSRPSSLTMTLWETPRIFQEEVQDEQMQVMNKLMSNLNFADGRTSKAQRTRLAAIPNDKRKHGNVLGQTLVYSFTLSSVEFHHKIGQLRQNKLLTLSSHNLAQHSPGHQVLEMESGLKVLAKVLSESRSIPFDVKFQFQALVQNGYLPPQIVAGLLQRLESVISTANNESSNSRPSCPISASAVRKLLQQIDFPSPAADPAEFSQKELWAYIQQNEREVRQGLTADLASERARQNLVMVFKVQVTPTRILLQGPEPEAKNRVLRKFPNHTQYFARVQFCDEDGQDLYFNSKVSLERIWKR